MGWQTGGLVVGAVAVVYGLVVAFGLRHVSSSARNRVVNGGALVLLMLAFALFLLPFLGVY